MQRLRRLARGAGGRGAVVLGTRSAVFAPIPAPGLIVDRRGARRLVQAAGRRVPLFRARPRAGARAGARHPGDARLGDAGARVAAERGAGRFKRLSLPRRAAHALPPTLRLVDLRRNRCTPASRPPRTRHPRHLAADGQVLVYINRRGYAPTLVCKACGWIAPCSECDARMTVHRHAERLRCHHCGADRPLPKIAPPAASSCAPSARAPSASRTRSPNRSRACRSRGSTATSCATRRARGGGRAGRERRGADPGRHADGDQGPRLPERHAGRGAERRPGPLQHRLPRRRAARADHRAGGRPRRPRRPPGRGADPDRVSASIRC